MTMIDLAAMERTADLGDRADRLMLADAYEDAGLDDMAQLLREDCPYRAHVVRFTTEGEMGHMGDWDESAMEATKADHVCSHDGGSGEALCFGADEDAMDGSVLVVEYRPVWAVQDDQGPFDGKSPAWREGFRDFSACGRSRRWDHYGRNCSYLFDSSAELLAVLREAFGDAARYEEEAD